jgi:hypothetical protein
MKKMKKETRQKKAWKKPEVQDLAVQNTASGVVPLTNETTLGSLSS